MPTDRQTIEVAGIPVENTKGQKVCRFWEARYFRAGPDDIRFLTKHGARMGRALFYKKAFGKPKTALEDRLRLLNSVVIGSLDWQMQTYRLTNAQTKTLNAFQLTIWTEMLSRPKRSEDEDLGQWLVRCRQNV